MVDIYCCVSLKQLFKEILILSSGDFFQGISSENEYEDAFKNLQKSI